MTSDSSADFPIDQPINQPTNQPIDTPGQPLGSDDPSPPDGFSDSSPIDDGGLLALARQNPAAGAALAALGLVLLAFVAYLPATRGDYLWLDDVSVTQNPSIRTTDGVQRCWTAADSAGRYEPLTLTSFWLNFRMWQVNPVGYHLTNVLLNALVALMLWVLLRRLDIPAAWPAAAAFALHPVHVQAVAWISGRSVVLSAVFYLAALLVYLRYVGLTPPPPGQKKVLSLPDDPSRLWMLAFVLFLCAVLSNAVALTFPFAVALIVWWKRGRVTAAEAAPLAPFVAAGAAGGILVAVSQSKSLAVHALTSAVGVVSPIDHVLFGARAIWFYALKVIAPFSLIFDYPRWSSSIAEGGLCLVALAGVVAALWAMRERIGRGPFAAVMLFIVTLLPVLGIVDPPALRYSFVADRHEYLASAALIVLIAAGLSRGVSALVARNAVNPTAGSLLAGVVLAILFILSCRGGLLFVSDQKLWADTVSHNSRSWLGATNYGDVLLENRYIDEAEKWFEQAHTLAPGDPSAIYQLGVVAEARAYEQNATGHKPEADALRATAAERFHEAIRLDPDFARANVELGNLLASEKDEDGAIAAFTEAVRADPDSVRARIELGAALRRAKRFDDAETALNHLIDLTPEFAPAHTELGNVYLEEKNVQAALDEWQKAVQLDRYNTTVLLNYGALLDSSDQPQLAREQFFLATGINPNLAVAWLDLGRVDLKLGRRQDAVVELNTAVELDPSDAKAKAALQQAQADFKRLGPGTQPSSMPSSMPSSIPATAP